MVHANSLIAYTMEAASLVWMAVIGGRGSLSTLRRGTAMVIDADLDQSACIELVRRIEVICDCDDHPRVWKDTEGSDTRIFAFEKDIPDLVGQFRIDERIHEINDYLGLKISSWFLMANRIVPKPGNLGSGGGLHRDSPFSNQVKLIWYLNDVGPENGPFQYLPGTNFNLFRNRSRYPIGETRFPRIDAVPKDLSAKAGTLVICDTKCIHGGKPIKSGVRHAVTLYTHTNVNELRRISKTLGLKADVT